jgi:putative transposase
VRPTRTRLPSFNYLGPYRYFLTFCTAGRRKLFIATDVVDLVLAQILRAANEVGFEIPAYCFMPDHVHLLIEGTSATSDLRKFVKLAKQYSGFSYCTASGRRLWQPSYFDHVLREEEDTWSVARYIVENPIRAGLVQTATAYPFLGSATVTVRDLLTFVQIAPSWRQT